MTPDAPWLSVWVPGEPIPQGSLKAYVRGGRARLTSDNPALRGWRTAITLTLRRAMRLARVAIIPRPDGVRMSAEFVFLVPLVAHEWPTVRPDLDKLVRAVADAGTGTVYEDDAQIVAISGAAKVYDRVGMEPGVRLCYWRLPNPRETGTQDARMTGQAGHGWAWRGRAGQGRQGRRGRAWLGRVRQGGARLGRAGRAGQGAAGRGKARQGEARQGTARLGRAGVSIRTECASCLLVPMRQFRLSSAHPTDADARIPRREHV